MDCDTFFVYLFMPEKRAELQLEALWDPNSPGDPLAEPLVRMTQFTRRPYRRGRRSKQTIGGGYVEDEEGKEADGARSAQAEVQPGEAPKVPES